MLLLAVVGLTVRAVGPTAAFAPASSHIASTPYAGPPQVADILGVSTDAHVGGGVAHIVGSALTAYPDDDPAAGSDLLVEALGDDSVDGPVLVLPVERRWRDTFVMVSLPPASSPICHRDAPRPCLYRLRISNARGSTMTSFVNAPELHWVQPFARPGGTADVFGRRFWGEFCVLLRHNDGRDDAALPACLPATVRNENRLSFTLPYGVGFGKLRVELRDAASRLWGSETVTSGMSAMDTLTVIAPPPQMGLVLNASAPPYSLDPTARRDVTMGLFSAIVAATANGTRPGGTVVLGPGNFLLNSTAGCRPSTGVVYTAICELPKQFAVTIAGTGIGKTVLQVGSALGSLVQATPLSFRDLTVTDLISDPRTAWSANQSAAYGSSLVGLDWASTGARRSRTGPPASASMLGSGLDWSSSVLMNNTDVTLERVHLISTRAEATISFGNTQRLTIKDSVIDGGCVWLNAPLRDVRFTGNLVRNGGKGNGWGGSGMAIRLGSGHFTGLLFENNTIDHLVPDLVQSGFSGRFFVAQHMIAERVYFGNNINRRAGPGNLSQQNSGEQLLWETLDDVPLPRGAVAFSDGTSVTLVSPASLDVNSSDNGWSPLLAYFSRVGGASAATRGTGNDWRYSHANVEFHNFCHIDEATGLCAPNVTIGMLHVVQGRGVGQTRRIYGMSADNRTLFLDRAFAVPPDASSVISVTGGTMVDLIARDVVIHGGTRSQVASADHTATTAVVVWDSGHRLTYSEFDVTDIRQTVLVNAWRNSTVSDVVIRGIRSNYTRAGVIVGTQGQASDGGPHSQWDENQPNVGVSIRNVTLHTVVPSSWDAAKPQEGHGCDSVTDGGIVASVGCGYSYNTFKLGLQTGTSMIAIEDVQMSNVSVAVNFAAPCGEAPAARVQGSGRFAGLLIRNVEATGGRLGLLVNDNVSVTAAGVAVYDVNMTNFNTAVNVSWDLRFRRQWHGAGVGSARLQPQLQLLTPFVPLAVKDGGGSGGGKQWAVKFRNVGLSAGMFTLHLDTGLTAKTTRWNLTAMSGPEPTVALITLQTTAPPPHAGTACGELSDSSGGSARFCVALT